MTEALVRSLRPETLGPELRVPARRGQAPALVVRRRLIELLDDGVRRGVAVLSAPAGFGKSTLIASWSSLRRTEGRPVVVVCGEDDRTPRVFWAHVLDAIAGADRSLRDVTSLASSARPHEAGPALLGGLAGALLGSDQTVVLVVDEAERLCEPTIAELHELAMIATPRLRLVLSGRERPPLPLALRAPVRISTADLALTQEETSEVVARRGVTLGEHALSALFSATDGWPLAIDRAAVLLRDEPDADAAVARLVAGGELTDDLLTEILDVQPPEISWFLLSTSVAERVWPGLAAQLSRQSHADDTLAALVRANLFVDEATDGGRSFVYRPMLRRILTGRLAGRPRDAVRLHRTAAEWLTQTGRLRAAVAHLAAAGDWSRAAALAVEDLSVGSVVLGDDELGALFAEMPHDVAGAEAAVIRAAARLAAGDPAGCEQALADVAAQPPVRPVSELALETATELLELLLAVRRRDVAAGLESVVTLRRLLATGPPALVHDRPELHALLAANEGSLLLHDGRLDAAATAFERGMALAEGERCAPLRLQCVAELALVEALRSRLFRAIELADAAELLATELDSSGRGTPVAARVARTWVHMEHYALSRAKLDVAELETRTSRQQEPVAAALLSIVRARIARGDHDLGLGRRVLDQARTGAGSPPLPIWLDRWLLIVRASLQAGTGHAPLLLLPAAAGSGSITLPGGEVEDQLQVADRALARGEVGRARTAAQHALALAEPQRLRRPFAEAPHRLQSFMLSDPGLAPRSRWLGTATRDRDTDGDDGQGRLLVQPLTEKEQEVLEHLSALLTTTEIAEAMFVSVNTVKSHVRGILRKLSATRRNEAVRRARELDLLN